MRCHLFANKHTSVLLVVGGREERLFSHFLTSSARFLCSVCPITTKIQERLLQMDRQEGESLFPDRHFSALAHRPIRAWLFTQ